MTEDKGLARGPSRPAARRSSGKKTTRRRGKFNNTRVEIDGHKFDSKVESRRYLQLRDMQDRGEIERLELQVRFPLYACGFYHQSTNTWRADERVKVCDYVADFTYHREGRYVVEDVKGGPVTPLFRLKQKMMRACYGIEVVEVRLASR